VPRLCESKQAEDRTIWDISIATSAGESHPEDAMTSTHAYSVPPSASRCLARTRCAPPAPSGLRLPRRHPLVWQRRQRVDRGLEGHRARVSVKWRARHESAQRAGRALIQGCILLCLLLLCLLLQLLLLCCLMVQKLRRDRRRRAAAATAAPTACCERQVDSL
jgi:hypothetical protein